MSFGDKVLTLVTLFCLVAATVFRMFSDMISKKRNYFRIGREPSRKILAGEEFSCLCNQKFRKVYPDIELVKKVKNHPKK